MITALQVVLTFSERLFWPMVIVFAFCLVDHWIDLQSLTVTAWVLLCWCVGARYGQGFLAVLGMGKK
jgi:hypothetical protein